MNRTKLFDLSKCFLGNRDKFCSYEQALTDFNSAHKRKKQISELYSIIEHDFATMVVAKLETKLNDDFETFFVKITRSEKETLSASLEVFILSLLPFLCFKSIF